MLSGLEKGSIGNEWTFSTNKNSFKSNSKIECTSFAQKF